MCYTSQHLNLQDETVAIGVGNAWATKLYAMGFTTRSNTHQLISLTGECKVIVGLKLAYIGLVLIIP